VSAPTVTVGGFSYRLNEAGRMERVRHFRERTVTGEAWMLVTERTEDAIRAAAALAVLHGSVRTMDGAGLDAVFYLATGIRPDKPVRVDGMALSGAAHLFAASSGFPREVRADITPRTQAQLEHARISNAIASADARATAARKGLKLWNGREPHSHILGDAGQHLGLNDRDNLHLFVCATSRAAAIRMLAECRGGDIWGIEGRLRKYWHEGAWGDAMSGIEPEPGVWYTHKNTKAPVRIWPKEKADA
jgi:hypothetical protein